MEDADDLYRPTEFWQPAVDALLSDLERLGIAKFKSWPSAAFFFYPRYSPVFTNAMVAAVLPTLKQVAPKFSDSWFTSMLVGSFEANRDVDVALAQLDSTHLALDIENVGESEIGSPPQRYRPFGASGPAMGKPHLNYLKVITAASRHLERPIRTVIEIGAGHGALGEILLAADPTIQYVDIDIPPLSVIANYYLASTFEDLIFRNNVDLRNAETLELAAGGPNACLSAWHLPRLVGRADLFVNAFSFQEMEPHVVRNYAEQIARLDTDLVVSLNSRNGKPLRSESAIGVTEQVTSNFIASTFEALGYEDVARLGRPAAPPQAELLILRRRAN